MGYFHLNLKLFGPRAWKGVSFGPGKGVVVPGSFWQVPTYFDIKCPLEGGVCVCVWRGGGGVTVRSRVETKLLSNCGMISMGQMLLINAGAEVAGGIHFGLKLYLNPYFVYTIRTKIPCTDTYGIMSHDM